MVGFDELAATDIGRALIWRVVGLLRGQPGGCGAGSRGRIQRASLVLAGAAAAAVMLVHVEAGHAAAEGPFRWGQIVAQWGHFAAGGVWLGGLAALLLGIRGEPGRTKSVAVRVLRRGGGSPWASWP